MSFHTIVGAAANDPPTKIQNVQIEGPGFPMTSLYTSGTPLETLQKAQQHAWADRPLHTNNHVQIFRLPATSERPRAIKWRTCKNMEPRIFEFDDCPTQRGSGRSPRTRNIRSKTNPDVIWPYSQRMFTADEASNFYDSAYT